MASASLLQGQLLPYIKKSLMEEFDGLSTEAQFCLQFARSTPGITTALCGMKDVEHVRENIGIASLDNFDEDVINVLTSGPAA